MNVFIKLTYTSSNTGPFDLYSNVDGYVTPFETNIPKTSLVNGYISTVVPNSTTSIRIKSEGDCEGYATIDVVQPTTSTTTSTTTLLFTTTTTTTSSTSSTTTTTSTTQIPIHPILIAKAVSGIVEGLCGLLYNDANVENTIVLYFQSGSSAPIIGQQLYTDNLCTIPYIGDDAEWGGIILWDVDYDNVFNSVVGVNLVGEISSITSCASVTTTTTSTVFSSTTTTTTTLSPTEYTTRLEEVAPLTYVGEALVGASESSPVWRIKRIDETSGIVVLWADGNDNFDNIWDDYLTITYS